MLPTMDSLVTLEQGQNANEDSHWHPPPRGDRGLIYFKHIWGKMGGGES